MPLTEALERQIERVQRSALREERQVRSFGRELYVNIWQGIPSDYRESAYLFLHWIEGEYGPKRLLCPGSGDDWMPKTVFGDRVVHTSLEQYGDGKEYFPLLGRGVKVTADNRLAPFSSGVFDAILIMDLSPDLVFPAMQELVRVTAREGVVALASNFYVDDQTRIGELAARKDFRKVVVPEIFQKQGPAKTEFSLFQKLAA